MVRTLFSQSSSIRPRWLLGVAAALLCAIQPLNGALPERTHVFSGRVAVADDYYLGRSNPSNLEQAVRLLRQDVSDHPNDYEAWWRIARAEAHLGTDPKDEKGQIAAFQAGIDAGRKAVALQPNRVEGHFWLGANYGLLAEDEGWFKGLRMLDTIRQEMESVVRLDPDYEQAAGERTLARIYYRAPFFKGGDKQRSIELLKDCLKRFPHDSFALLYLADDYLAVGRKAEARGLLVQILGLCPDPIYGPELAGNQAEARDRLQQEFRSGR
jgi:cytochrome c-type biogenesis protein CcmH/NrfG